MLDLESAPDKPLPREIAQYGAKGTESKSGRPTLLTDENGARIIDAIAKGAFLKAACEAVDVGYQNFREWVRRGQADEEAGLDTRYARFSHAVTRAQAEHKNGLAAAFSRGGDGKHSDWRAQAWHAERRYEEFRLPKENAGLGLTLQLSTEQAASLIEALRVARATDVTPTQDVDEAK